jgi:RNA 3'-terminal phosphate cyclase
VRLSVEPSELKAVDFVEKGKLLAIRGISHAAKELEQAQVADRQAKAARTLLWDEFQVTPEIAVQYVESDCAGSGILLWLEYENAVLGGSALGERGKRSETVGSEAANALIRQKSVVDEHTGDQLLPYLAVSGGKFRYNALLTGHLLTNLHIINQVLGTDIKAVGGEGAVGDVVLK